MYNGIFVMIHLILFWSPSILDISPVYLFEKPIFFIAASIFYYAIIIKDKYIEDQLNELFFSILIFYLIYSKLSNRD